ncbi:MAG: hypothetical protein NTX24_01885 [Candidatus Pacearchaeota archaeon]|nr:hypothetical protein [Candidatus Pacearchaeota archaeon]
MEEQDKAKLQELIEELGKYRGRHTELITVYAPQGSNINQIANQIASEQSTAMNIKSKATRTNVIDALERIIRHLKLYKNIPQNGMAIFCGNISEREGQPDLKIWAIETPQPLRVKFYRCDQVFVLEPLKDMLQSIDVYGLIVLDRREATIGVLDGKSITKLKHLTSGVPGKFKSGGQCLDPRSVIKTKKGLKSLKEIEIGDEVKALDLKLGNEIFTKATDKWVKKKLAYREIFVSDCWSVICSLDHTLFKEENGDPVEISAKDLKVGESLITFYDNGPTRGVQPVEIIKIEDFKKEIELIDIETSSHNFFANGILVHNSAARFDRLTEEMAKEFYRRISESMRDAFTEMPKLKGILVGGPGPTKEQFLKEGQIAVDLRRKILAVKDVGYTDEQGLGYLVEASQEDIAAEAIIKEKEILKKFFETLGRNPTKAAYLLEDVKKALENGAVQELILYNKLDKQITKELEEKAKSTAANIFYVSDETNEGLQFKNLSGVGAILRFAIQ